MTIDHFDAAKELDRSERRVEAPRLLALDVMLVHLTKVIVHALDISAPEGISERVGDEVEGQSRIVLG